MREAHQFIPLDPITLQSTAETRFNLGVGYLLSAAVLCGRVGHLEEEHCGEEFGEFWWEIFANASNAVFSSVASLESYANELFIDHETVFPEHKNAEKLWKSIERKSAPEKFERILKEKKAAAFERGKTPYQDVHTIVQLRNDLIHFKPEWFGKQKKHAKLSKKLKSRATQSSFFSGDEPIFPRGWASHATVKWIIQSVLSFILEFEQRVGISPRMGKFKDRLNKL